MSSVSRNNTHSSISNAITCSNVSFIVLSSWLVLTWAPSRHCHCHHSQVHFATYPFCKFFFPLLLCIVLQKMTSNACRCFPLRIALVQKTTSGSCIVHHHLLCVAKRVLICSTFIIFKRWWGVILHHVYVKLVEFFCRLSSKPRSCTSKGSSSNARWTWRCNGRKWMCSWKLKKVLQGECVH